jgi:hypothetical protein
MFNCNKRLDHDGGCPSIDLIIAKPYKSWTELQHNNSTVQVLKIARTSSRLKHVANESYASHASRKQQINQKAVAASKTY